MIKPHICVPFERVGEYLSFLKREKVDLEIYFGSQRFDELKEDDIIGLKKKLDYNPRLTVHAPFMDLSPAAIDRRIRQVTVERFSSILDFAEILKAEVVVFHSGYDRRRYDKMMDIWLRRSLETWRHINVKATKMGIKMAIENIFEDDPENLRLLAEEMDSQNFGLCLDTGHFNLFSRVSLSEWLDQTQPHIIELHLHDNDGITDGHLSIGDGSFDFNTLFKRLKGKSCVYTIESHTVEEVKRSMERLRNILLKGDRDGW